MKTAVIDSSPLIALVHLGLAENLDLFFERVFVPRAVHKEVSAKHRFRRKLGNLYRRGFFERCLVGDIESIHLLQLEVGEGEAEALVQTQEKSAAYIIGDDHRAREIGAKQGLGIVGTARILARLYLEGRADEPRKLVNRLRRDLGFRISNDILLRALEMAEEPL